VADLLKGLRIYEALNGIQCTGIDRIAWSSNVLHPWSVTEDSNGRVSILGTQVKGAWLFTVLMSSC